MGTHQFGTAGSLTVSDATVARLGAGPPAGTLFAKAPGADTTNWACVAATTLYAAAAATYLAALYALQVAPTPVNFALAAAAALAVSGAGVAVYAACTQGGA